MVNLDYRDGRPIYVQIMDGLKEQISAGVRRPGDRLPSVRELASQLTINPNTIQRAYRQLEMEGWIVTMQGKGCFVCKMPGISRKEQERLLAIFDNTTAALLGLGITRKDLIARLEKEEESCCK